MLTPDHLGAKGEARFRELCEDAQLICNKSERDRTGWDFIVEFPFGDASDASASLDARETPPSCHVQVKTILEKNDAIKMRLSSAEYLAKELKPAFVYVLKVNEALEFTDAFLIHLLDESLGKVLQRLRKEEAQGNKKLNKKTISFSMNNDGVRLEPSGHALRRAIQAAVGPKLSKYTSQKSEQLSKLGYDTRSHTLAGTLHLNSREELVDAFLGLKQDIPASNVRRSQTRFGITLPVGVSEGLTGKISIQPHPADTCTIAVCPVGPSAPALFRGEIFFPAIPDLPDDYFKALVKSDLFSMTHSKRQWTLTAQAALLPMTPERWRAYWTLVLVMAQGAGTIRISSESKRFNLNYDVTKRTTKADPKHCQEMLETSEKTSGLLRLAGVGSEPLLTFEEMDSIKSDIAALHSLTQHTAKRQIVFMSEGATNSTTLPMIDFTFAGFFKIGNVTIGYYGLAKKMNAKRQGNRLILKTTDFCLDGLLELPSFPTDYDDFMERAKRYTGCDRLLSLNADSAATSDYSWSCTF